MPRLQDIERAAGALFLQVDMPEIAADEPYTAVELEGWMAAGHLWVWVDADRTGTVAAYLAAELVDGAAHIAQVSVDPRWAHRGVGRELIDHLAAWAGTRDLPAVTLTTFRDVPWNAPYYTRIGFRVMSSDEIGPELRSTVAREAAAGLDPRTRVAMTRAVRIPRDERA